MHINYVFSGTVPLLGGKEFEGVRRAAKGGIFFTFNVTGAVAAGEQQKLVRVVYWGRAKCFARE